MCLSCSFCFLRNGLLLSLISSLDSSVPLVFSSELLPGINSAPVGSFPKFSSGFSENLVGGLLILPDRGVCSAVLLVICALLLAGAIGKGLLPFSCYY
jgi:hypothetical protein